MRNSEEKSNSSSSSISNQAPNANQKIRIAVLGQHEVGKSALTVRYLTKRYIGEYKSNTDLLYRQSVTIGQSSMDVEIVDIASSCRSDSPFPIEEINRSHGFVIVYSITDRSSFTFALDCLEVVVNHYNNNNHQGTFNSTISDQNGSLSVSGSGSSSSSPNASPQPKSTYPILLVANKCDLEHLRTVDKVEGVNASVQYGCQFFELSTAENSPEVYTSFQSLISTFVAQNSQPVKRKFSVSKMLGNLRIGRTSPSHQVVTSQASIVDTDSLPESGAEDIPTENTSPTPAHFRQSSAPELNCGSTRSNISGSICNLKSKLVELHSLRKRHNSPPICSL